MKRIASNEVAVPRFMRTKPKLRKVPTSKTLLRTGIKSPVKLGFFHLLRALRRGGGGMESGVSGGYFFPSWFARYGILWYNI